MRVERKTVLRPPVRPAQRSDYDLERQARAGDVEAFGELVQRYCPAVTHMINSRVVDPFEVERRVVEVFCAAWRDLRHPLCPHRGFLGILSHALAGRRGRVGSPPLPLPESFFDAVGQKRRSSRP
ncbi:RNA polymerase sigma factor [Amycolatopsis sp. cmx-4-83]|uniref:RNA polymerase sigma factor n=1 Tax=Amycolatopsis sp. cmx-4-83 TaxID=2790940 RepID=UPI003978B3D1